jgi:hypothetical protein
MDDALKRDFEAVCGEMGLPMPADSVPETYLSAKTPRPGCMKGQIWMSDDFDAPLDDFKEYME